jgi:hypothetical protein
LEDGDVLQIGGSGPIDTVYRMNGSTLAWSAVTSLNTACEFRGFSPAVLLNDGRVFVTGFNCTEVYDPGDDTWTDTDSFPGAAEPRNAALLPSGKVLVVEYNSKKTWIYDADGDTWTATGDLNVTRSTNPLVLPTTGGAILADDNAGFSDGTNGSELYNEVAGTWSLVNTTNGRGYSSGCALPDGRVIVVGGDDADSGLPVDTVDIFTPGTGAWTALSVYPVAFDGPTGCGVLVTGDVLVAGGYDGADLLLSAAVFSFPSGGGGGGDGSGSGITPGGYVSDWAAKLRAKLYQQFADKPNWISLAEDVMGPQFQAVEDAANQLGGLADIATRVGVQLDTIGNIVGQLRAGLIDSVYRLYLSARIKANKSSGTNAQLYEIITVLFGALDMAIRNDTASGAFELKINTVITALRAAVATAFIRDAKAAGVRANVVWQESPTAELFQFDSGPGFDQGKFAGAAAAD